ncbi:MAG: hypothetical protein WD627_10485, partial [Actinomycetota bacterium]
MAGRAVTVTVRFNVVTSYKHLYLLGLLALLLEVIAAPGWAGRLSGPSSAAVRPLAPASQPAASLQPASDNVDGVRQSLETMPLQFVPNAGQTDPRVSF